MLDQFNLSSPFWERTEKNQRGYNKKQWTLWHLLKGESHHTCAPIIEAFGAQGIALDLACEAALQLDQYKMEMVAQYMTVGEVTWVASELLAQARHNRAVQGTDDDPDLGSDRSFFATPPGEYSDMTFEEYASWRRGRRAECYRVLYRALLDRLGAAPAELPWSSLY